MGGYLSEMLYGKLPKKSQVVSAFLVCPFAVIDKKQLKIHLNIVLFFIMTTVDLGLGIPMYSDNSNQREST